MTLDHLFICESCQQKADQGWPSFDGGTTCQTCLDERQLDWWAEVRRHEAIPLAAGPEFYDMAEFHAFTFRLALSINRTKAFADLLRVRFPLLLNPVDMGQHLKQLIIEASPEHFSTFESKGHSRMFTSGQFRLIGGKISKQDVLDAVVKAGIFKPSARQGEGN